MNELKSTNYSIFFKENGFNELNLYLQIKNYSKIFVHVDKNTNKLCLKYFLKKIKFSIDCVFISDEGEENKNIKTCLKLWEGLSNNGADRKSLLINLGGGVVGDLGGFVASTFKRGIDYINVPTTLLSMVDASIGGKTGVDLGILKNQIGIFNNPKMIIIETDFLKTLDKLEILSGYAEMFKHSLISKTNFFGNIIKSDFNYKNIENIKRSIEIKNNIVISDPFELKKRKILNFGHTIGHAVESLSLTKERRLLHGNAIAIGMIMECYISHIIFNFPDEKLYKIKKHLIKQFGCEKFSKSEILRVMELIRHDKKNTHGKVNFMLLQDIGVPKYDIDVSNNLISESFRFYCS